MPRTASSDVIRGLAMHGSVRCAPADDNEALASGRSDAANGLLPSAICYLLSVICYLLSAICYLLSAIFNVNGAFRPLRPSRAATLRGRAAHHERPQRRRPRAGGDLRPPPRLRRAVRVARGVAAADGAGQSPATRPFGLGARRSNGWRSTDREATGRRSVLSRTDGLGPRARPRAR